MNFLCRVSVTGLEGSRNRAPAPLDREKPAKGVHKDTTRTAPEEDVPGTSSCGEAHEKTQDTLELQLPAVLGISRISGSPRISQSVATEKRHLVWPSRHAATIILTRKTIMMTA